MDLGQHLRLMSGWHVWAFERLYAVVDDLSEEEYRRDAGLFFKSVHGTLNHMLLIEQMWASRLAGDPKPPETLADEVESDRARLRARILASAASWGEAIRAMSVADFSSDFTYRSMANTEHTLPRVSVIHTMFTHGAHHRGQVSTALTQAGKPAPEMDFPYYLLTKVTGSLHG